MSETVTGVDPWVRKAAGPRQRATACWRGSRASMLLLLCVEMILKYVLQLPGFNVDGDPRSEAARIIAMVHGWVYVLYLVTVFDLWSKMRWRLGRLATMAAAGVVPVMSFILERKVHAQAAARIEAAGGPGRRHHVRIVHVSDCFAPRTGGIESQVGDLAARQVAAGHEVHVLTATLGAGGERGGVVDVEHGVHVHRLGARLPFDLPVNPVGPRLLRAALRQLRPDVVHVHAGVLSPFAYDGARIAIDSGLPTAITWHCMLDGVVGALRTAVSRTRWQRTPAALSAVSHAAAARVREVFGTEVSRDAQRHRPRPVGAGEPVRGARTPGRARPAAPRVDHAAGAPQACRPARRARRPGRAPPAAGPAAPVDHRLRPRAGAGGRGAWRGRVCSTSSSCAAG